MSDFFNDKHYSDYFEQLNKRINASVARQPAAPATKICRQGASKRRKKGFYRTFRLNPLKLAAVAVVLVLIPVTVGLCLRSHGIKSLSDDTQSTVSAQKNKKGQPKIPVNQSVSFVIDENTVEIPAANDADTAVIVRKSDNRVIAARDPHKKVYPASTLKIMTMITAVDYIDDMDDTFTMSYEVTDPLYLQEATMAGFSDGESVNMTDLLYGLILPSGADSAMGLALKIAGSEEGFVELMNEKARELDLEDSHFSNVSGLFAEDNYTSAYDMAIVINAAMENKLCREILSTYQYTTAATPQHPQGIPLQSTLFSYMYGTEPETAVILGGKTGFVNESGYCIASFGENISKTEEYIVVTMGNSSKWPAFYGQIDLYKEFAR